MTFGNKIVMGKGLLGWLAVVVRELVAGDNVRVGNRIRYRRLCHIYQLERKVPANGLRKMTRRIQVVYQI